MEVFPWSGIPSASKGEGLEGMGTKRKRMPSCNGKDRGFYDERIIRRRDTPRRKSADFEGGGDWESTSKKTLTIRGVRQ